LPVPPSLLASLETVKDFNKEAFEQVHQSGESITSIRINPYKITGQPLTAGGVLQPLSGLAANVPWTQYGYYLPQRPAFIFDPLLHAGCYYVQEASSMFLEQALLQNIDASQPLKILDLCAAPGGKSTHLLSLVNEHSLVVSNEVIKARASVLEENITKWGMPNTVVTNNDPKDFARLENYFDVIVIDAPCSGSGLFRKDPAAINEWSEANVQLCSQRQQRIIADVWPALKQGGLLIYSTCSYSAEENEGMMDWLNTTFAVTGKRLTVAAQWGITEVTVANDLYGYRFWPHRVKGEGFFLSCFQKAAGGAFHPQKNKKNNTEALTKNEAAIVQPWLQPPIALHLFKHQQELMALPQALAAELPILQNHLYIKKAGVTLGKLAGKELIPDHALAVSTLCNKDIAAVDLLPYGSGDPHQHKEQALQYLRREELVMDIATKGWMLVRYEGHHLGWIKALGNRINNYYPKNYRILKGG
jgi:16S rRNA C967 or C1407 C5-methylase (RsmB/RsmF family)/NOL1/NOP2/fmu family ribosome biogenesis protein